MTTSFRSDVVAGFGTMMAAFIAANPTLLLEHLRHRPASLSRPTPFSYLDLRPETISHANSVRDRVMEPTVVVVDQWTESGEVMDRLDDLVDALVDHFTSYPHIVAGTIWDDMTVADETVDDHPAIRFSFGNLQITEGRV